MAGILSTGDIVTTPFQWMQAQQFRKNAETMLMDAKKPAMHAGSVFLLSYESIHAACLGFLYCHGLAPAKGPGHRQQVLALVLQELQLPHEEQAEVLEAHKRRNETTYRSPAPPVSKQDAANLLAIATRVVLQAKANMPDWFID
jgi:hypothetical protein